MFAVHYRPKKISEIGKGDAKVCLLGKVKSVAKGSFILVDESGEVEITCEQRVEKGKLLRVFCSLVGDNLVMDFFQDMSKLDLDLLKRVKTLWVKYL